MSQLHDFIRELIIQSDRMIQIIVCGNSLYFPNKLIDALFNNTTIINSGLIFEEDEITAQELNKVVFCDTSFPDRYKHKNSLIDYDSINRMYTFIDKWLHPRADNEIDKYYKDQCRHYFNHLLFNDPKYILYLKFMKINYCINNSSYSSTCYQHMDLNTIDIGKNYKIILTSDRLSLEQTNAPLLSFSMRHIKNKELVNNMLLTAVKDIAGVDYRGPEVLPDDDLVSKILPQEVINGLCSGQIIVQLSEEAILFIGRLSL